MVIFAIGGVIVVGVATYDDHSDYSDYSDYSNYSDAAERRRRELELKRSSLQEQKETAAARLNDYKRSSINNFLGPNNDYKNMQGSAFDLNSANDMNNQVKNNYKELEKNEINTKTHELKEEIDAITEAINDLQKVKLRLEEEDETS